MDLICEERPADSLYIDRIWRSESDSEIPFISMAQPRWNMVVTKYQGTTTLTVRGPETRASSAVTPKDAEFFGIMFKPGTLMPDLPAKMIMDRADVNLPEANSQSFWLNGAAWQFPDFENAETFVERLVREGLVIHDSLVAAVLEGGPVEMSLRTVQRRFLQATGMTYGTVSQIKRARNATTLLKQGMSILDTVYEAGYTDQPHMTRALKHLVGQTPAQLISETKAEPLSFLFKTEPF